MSAAMDPSLSRRDLAALDAHERREDERDAALDAAEFNDEREQARLDHEADLRYEYSKPEYDDYGDDDDGIAA